MKEIDDIHIPFLAWLNELKIPRVYHRPDRKSGIQTGWPDFTVAYMGRVVFIEVKTPEGRLSKVQGNVLAFLLASGNPIEVCRSVEECKEAVRKHVLHDGLTEAFAKQLNAAPVLAEPTKHQVANVVKVHEGEARESTSVGIRQDSNTGAETRSHGQPISQDSRGGVQFYVGSWNGTFYVFAPDGVGSFRMIREASTMDRIRLPTLPA